MTMTDTTFTEIEVRIASHLRVNSEATFQKSDMVRIFADVTARTVDRTLQRLVALGVVRKTDGIRPALYRWGPRRGTDETVRRLVAAYVDLNDRIS